MTVAPDGSRVVFLRSTAGDDPVNRLWTFDPASGEERCVADPDRLPPADVDGALSEEERSLRERTRETGAGIIAYATDRAVQVVAFALWGRLHVGHLVDGEVAAHPCSHTVIDPRPDPSGERLAYVRAGALYVTTLTEGEGWRVAGPSEGEAQVSWGLPDFIAAEEMGRTRGYWWSPDGHRLCAARVDNAPVGRWHISDPADPSAAPRPIAYPAAGTDNADTALFVVSLDGHRVQVHWDARRYPYLVTVRWDRDGPLTLCVQSRDQRAMQILTADPDSGTTQTVRELHDEHWVEIVAGVPRWLADGRLVHTLDHADTRKVAVDGQPVSPDGLQVRRVLHADVQAVTVLASTDPTAVGVWQVPLDGATAPVSLAPAEGVHDARLRGDTMVLQLRDLHHDGVRTVVDSPHGQGEIRDLSEAPALTPRPELRRLGQRELAVAVLLPGDYRPQDGRLPVLLDPYGGPHAQRVLQRRAGFATAQWFAEAGFAVVVADGRGTPGRGPAWERAVAGDLVSAPLQDQVEALQAAAEHYPLDLDAVAIRGWSFGGFLAAAAVLRRPEVFHAGIAGAPVTDWSLYDTHYTERYLSTPQAHPERYHRSSLLEDAPRRHRPLLLIHGLADDNVVAGHTLRLSQTLLANGHPHQVLPLTRVTHMTPQETVAENLLWLQLAFLRGALDLPAGRWMTRHPDEQRNA